MASLAPLMQREHYMVGTTYAFDSGLELTGSYMWAPGATVRGEGGSAGTNVSAEVDNVFNLGIGYQAVEKLGFNCPNPSGLALFQALWPNGVHTRPDFRPF